MRDHYETVLWVGHFFVFGNGDVTGRKSVARPRFLSQFTRVIL